MRVHRAALLATLLTSFAAVGASSAHAQDYKIQLLRVNGKAYNETVARPINARECEDDVPLVFRVTGLALTGTKPKYVELWAGAGCNTTDRKSTTSDNKCASITHAETTSSDEIPEFEVAASKLCDAEGVRHLWFLGVNNIDQADDVGTHYGARDVSIDTDAPAAPKSVKGGAGETEIPIKWKSTDGDIDRYLLVWDPNAKAGGSGGGAGSVSSDDDGGTAGESTPDPSGCTTALLMGGDELSADLDELPDGLDGKEINGKVESADISGKRLGGDLAAVGVIAIDKAGNPSPVSALACLEVVPTTGFWDQYQMNGGKVDEGCACSLPGHGGRDANLGAAWPLVAALAWLAARTRRRRS